MRLEDIQPWVETWAIPELHAGVPGRGAPDAWHDALMKLEEMKLQDESFAGAADDTSIFLDQIRMGLVYRILEAAGFPGPSPSNA